MVVIIFINIGFEAFASLYRHEGFFLNKKHLQLFLTLLALSLPCYGQVASKLNEKTATALKYDIAYEFCGEFGWIDDSYCYLNHGVDNSVNAINSWFMHEGGDNSTLPTSKGRLRFGIEPRSGDLAEFDFRFRIRVKLPALEDRVELFLSDEEEGVNEQPVKAARNEELGNRNSTSLGLQFKKDEADRVSYRLGLGRGGQVYTRARYKDEMKFSEDASLRYYAEANYFSGDKLGFEVDASYGVAISDDMAFQLNNRFEFRDNSDDWFWRHEFQYLILDDDSASYLFTASINGISKPTYSTQQRLVSFRYKRKFLRDWLFLELEPFVLWLRQENFRPSVGMAIRAEVHFST